jgi:ribose transport system permease protein
MVNTLKARQMLFARLRTSKWILSFAASLLIWIVISLAYSHHGVQFEVVTGAAALAVPYVLAGMGEMLVIAGGDGNIDLSVPYVMTLAAYMASGRPGWGGLTIGLALAVGIGAAAGIVNGVLVLGAKIPPIVATLGSGYLLESGVEVYSQNAPTAPNSHLVSFVTSKVGGVPVMVYVFVALSGVVALVVRQSRYGRSLLAFGQSPRAAWYSGIAGRQAVATSYILSGALAGLAGAILGAYTGGATLDMATAFLLGAIAVVVLGGTPITGGAATVTGVWGGAMFLIMLGTLLADSRLGGGWQEVIQGIVIVGVVTIFGGVRRGAR